MAIAVRYSGQNVAAALSVAITLGGTPPDGDILVACFSAFALSTPPTLDTPAGWTAVGDGTFDGNRVVRLAVKRASSEASAIYTFTASGGGSTPHMAACMFSLSGAVAGGEFVDAYSNTAYKTSDKNLRGASITTTVQPTMLLHMGGAGATLTATAPSGMTEYSDTNDAYLQAYSAGLRITATGDTGDKDAQLSANSASKHAFLIAIREVAPPHRAFIGEKVW